MNKNKLIIIIFFTIGFCLNLLLIIPLDTKFKNDKKTTNLSETDDEINQIVPELSGSYTESFIHITKSNWSIAVTKDWCYGQGTWDKPYVIENVTIDGNPSLPGIFIQNSDTVYFKMY